ncbi:MAG: anthranilate phosphoribosyltransferase [Spirochaetota bacterium]
MSTKNLLEKVYNGQHLNSDESRELFSSIFNGEVDSHQLSAMLGAMKARREHPDEIAGAAVSMRSFALNPGLPVDGLFDTCGTGGDGKHSFNISSAVAIILASMGYKIAKHGNRSVSSLSGSADFYEKLGVPVSITADKALAYFNKTGFVFLFAPHYHPAMKHAVPVRKALATRTIFNYLGPLTNPAQVKSQMIGVYRKDFLPLYADAAKRIGYDNLVLYSSEDGMDEVSPYAPTHVIQIRGQHEEMMTIDPSPYITREEADSIPSRLDADGNAALFRESISQKGANALPKLVSLSTALALFTLGYSNDYEKCFAASYDHYTGGGISQTLDALTKENQ